MKIELHTIPNWDKPRSGTFKIIQDAWWIVDEQGNPLFYLKHNFPQCNQNEEIAKQLAKGREVKQLPFVYIPIRISDYIQS